jgi:hypothetical protein
MRLLDTRTLDVVEFLTDEDMPQYAILSHMWRGQEVSWAQWQDRRKWLRDFEDSAGSAKIAACCRLAASNGFAWVWVDTYV